MRIYPANHRSVEPIVHNNIHTDLRDMRDLVAGSISVRDAFRYVSNRVCPYVGSEGARLYLLDPERKNLIEAAVGAAVPERTADDLRLAADSFFSGRIVQASSHTRPKTTAACLPLTRGTERIGVLQFYFSRSTIRLEELRGAFTLVADLVSPVIVRSMIYERNLAKARTDIATSLLNREAFESVFANLVADADRECHPLSLVTFDICGFKEIDSRTADTMLRTVAEAARNNLREMDVIARSHQDEFLIALPTADEETTKAIIARVRNGVAFRDLSRNFDQLDEIKLNFAYAILGRDGDDASSLFASARLRKELSKNDPAATNHILMFPSPSPLQPR